MSLLRNEQGLAFLSYGFRPFFFGGAIYAGLAIAIWMPVYFGELTLHTAFAPLDWHIHEMLFGFLPAVIAGFLLTAIPNWTGRRPVRGNLLLIMAVVWVLGRVAVACSGQIGWGPAMLVDASFLLLAGAVAAREVIAAGNLRNMRVVALVLLLFACNVVFHIEAHVQGAADYSVRAGIAIIVLLISVIAGRIVPAFTRIWLMRQPQGAMPVPFSRFDGLAVLLGALALVAWVLRPEGMPTGVLCLAAGLFHFARLVRWAGYRTFANRILVILHIGYAFVPLGFLLAGMSAFGIAGVSAAIHAWMAGGAGIMTLAVMSRASLGHSGRPLVASAPTQACYVLVVVATLVRVAAVFIPAWSSGLIYLAAACWSLSFLGFALSYAPAFLAVRLDERTPPQASIPSKH
jgi:uncharacterized protein involved in response to NO